MICFSTLIQVTSVEIRLYKACSGATKGFIKNVLNMQYTSTAEELYKDFDV